MKNKYDVVAWWSGGVTSAVTCKLCIDLFGLDRVSFIFIDTANEDEDTYRFKDDCEKWYGKKIETITGIGDKHDSVKDVWYRYNSLNVANGAVCSSELKRNVREKWETSSEYNYQAFGFDLDEKNRAKAMKKNHSNAKPIFPLLMFGMTKKDSIEYIVDHGVKVPRVYGYGYLNNNCFKTGCVQGGIGYWQKIQKEFPEKFNNMAQVEHDLTNTKGAPVTMLKDQSKAGGLVFLKPHPDYPHIKDISMMKGRPPKPLFECNGFCTTNDLEPRNETENEINYSEQLNLFGNEKE